VITTNELLTSWLSDPRKNANDRLHARNRLSSLAAADPPPPPADEPPASPRLPLRLTPAELAELAATAAVWCLYRDPEPIRNTCNPWRCRAHLGATCGGSHTHDAHCRRCLYPTETLP
jgi:hypothetical protein